MVRIPAPPVSFGHFSVDVGTQYLPAWTRNPTFKAWLEVVESLGAGEGGLAGCCQAVELSGWRVPIPAEFS